MPHLHTHNTHKHKHTHTHTHTHTQTHYLPQGFKVTLMCRGAAQTTGLSGVGMKTQERQQLRVCVWLRCWDCLLDISVVHMSRAQEGHCIKVNCLCSIASPQAIHSCNYLLATSECYLLLSFVKWLLCKLKLRKERPHLALLSLPQIVYCFLSGSPPG